MILDEWGYCWRLLCRTLYFYSTWLREDTSGPKTAGHTSPWEPLSLATPLNCDGVFFRPAHIQAPSVQLWVLVTQVSSATWSQWVPVWIVMNVQIQLNAMMLVMLNMWKSKMEKRLLEIMSGYKLALFCQKPHQALASLTSSCCKALNFVDSISDFFIEAPWQPVQTFMKAISSGGHRRLHKPLPICTTFFQI